MKPFKPDLNEFLIDIPGSNPVGEFLKYQEDYDLIQEKMREDLNLPQGVWVQDLKSADWTGAEVLCSTILKSKSKDLQIAAWLTEIWMQLYQWPGLKAGLDLVQKLADKYWDTIYPQAIDGDQEFRFTPFIWINQKLTARLHRLLITMPSDPNASSITFGEYLKIRDALQKKSSALDVDTAKLMNEFQLSLQNTPKPVLNELNQYVENLKDETQKIEKFIDSKSPEDPPTLYHMREALNEFSKFFQETINERVEPDPIVSTEEQESKDLPSSVINDIEKGEGAKKFSGSFKNREDAYDLIEKAAAYLYKIEPHSPTPFLIRKAISWGQMSFEDLMTEVLQDQGSVNDMRRLLGLDHEIADNKPLNNQSISTEKVTPSSSKKLPWTIEHSG